VSRRKISFWLGALSLTGWFPWHMGSGFTPGRRVFCMELVPLSIHLLGAFEVRVRGAAMRSGRTRSVDWLLALLVLRQGRGYPQGGWISRSWLAGTFWPESREAQALSNLRRNLMDLREALGPEADRLRTPNRATLGFDLTGADVDVVRFDGALAAGDEGSLQEAVALYRGPLLEGCLEEWVFPERASRAEACLQALETLADRAAERGDPGAALSYLAQAAALDPLRDSTQRRRMQQLTASGDLPAALLTYREHRLRLHRELNEEPDPETSQLFQELRTGARRIGRRAGDRATGERGDGGTGQADKVKISLSAAPPIQPAPLPRPLTALIGRDQEVQEVVRSVRASRLVTLVGGGGVGKTRLAIQVAEELADDFPEGVAFIELASFADPALLPAAIVTALGVREAEAAAGAGLPGPEPLLQALCGWLALHPVLLVLDNCEHLVQAAAELIHELLAACPALRVLATSRQRLGLTGEAVWRVPSLPAPDPDRLPADAQNAVEAVLSYPAVQLFVERAAAARSEFRLAQREDAVAVARICRRLDGIPLALELAAARLSLLTLPQIAARLDDRFRLLTGGSRVALPRQQTLRALIDWSYHLLPEAERALLCRLSIFAGGWTLEAAEAVCGFAGVRGQGSGASPDGPVLTPDPWPLTPDVLDLLSALEEKSLVLVEAGALGLRYRMLETVREYAGQRLASSGELAGMRQRHRDWYLQLAEQTRAVAHGGVAGDLDKAALLSRLEAERENLWAALAWCQEEADVELAQGTPGTAAETGLRLASALFWFWVHRGYLTDGLQWLEGALARTADSPSDLRVHALWAASHLASAGGRRELSRSFLRSAREDQEKALIRARASGDRGEMAQALLQLANLSRELSDIDTADRLAREARELLEAVGDRVGVVRALQTISGIALEREDREAARPLLEERLAISRELGDLDFLVHALGALGHLARDEGDYPHAQAYYTESLSLRQQAGFAMATAQSLEDLGALAGRMQQPERAVRLLGAAEAFCETLGAHPPVTIAAEYEHAEAAGRAALGEAAFAAAWAEGRAMALEQAVEYALGED
jgi:predicted ATPase/DNA-binding SARP family transcriptional activator